MLLLLLAACPATPTPPGDTADTADTAAETCDWESPARLPLAWDAPGSTGVSPEDAFGFGVGELAFDVTWDDAVVSAVTLGFTPTTSYELDQGGAECPVYVGADVAWTVADGARLALDGQAEWVADTAERIPTSATGIFVDVDRGAAGVAPLDATSTFTLSAWRYADDGHVTFLLREAWALDAAHVRTCTRASNNPDALGCTDENTTPE